MEAGQYKDSRWSNPDLDPVKPELRTWGAVVSTFYVFMVSKLIIAGLLGILDF